MTVNKITTPPSQKGVIDKINEVIDNLGGGGGGLPSQAGNAGKFLTTDGTDASWDDVDALPSQAGYTDATLTTNGTDASWRELTQLPLSQVHCVVDTYSSGASWYRVYDDGWCEQGGRFYTPSQNNYPVTFLQTMADGYYSIKLTIYGQAVQTWLTGMETILPGSMSIFVGGTAGGFIGWEIAGYISQGA